MANSKIIVVEGPQGAGKTTFTDFLRNSLPYTNLYRLAGTSDSTETGKAKAEEMYYILMDYLKHLENKSINLVFDRTFFTEEVYCRMGKKAYTFTDIYEKLLDDFAKLDFEIYYLTLYLDDVEVFRKRLDRPGKAVFKGSEFSLENSVSQQETYLKLAEEIKEKYPNINVVNINTNRDIEEVKKEIRDIVGF